MEDSNLEYEDCISPAAFLRIRGSLPDGIKLSKAPIELAASFYLTLKKKDEANTGRGMKADLRAIASKLKAATDALDNMSFANIALVGMTSDAASDGQRAILRIAALKDEVRWMHNAIQNSVSMIKRPYIQRIPHRMDITIQLLAAPFQRATCLTITNSMHKDGEYLGRPLSPFGKFVIAFFAEVDPKISATRIGNCIRKNMETLHLPLAD